MKCPDKVESILIYGQLFYKPPKDCCILMKSASELGIKYQCDYW